MILFGIIYCGTLLAFILFSFYGLYVLLDEDESLRYHKEVEYDEDDY